MKTNQSRYNKYPVFTLSMGDKTFHRVMSGELTGLTVVAVDRRNMRAVKIQHEKAKGFSACAVVDSSRSIDWIIDQLINDVKLAV